LTLSQNYTYHSLFNTNVRCSSNTTCILLQALNFGHFTNPFNCCFLAQYYTMIPMCLTIITTDHHPSQKTFQPPTPTFQHNGDFLLHILKCQWVVKVVKLLVQGIFNYLQFFSWLLANIINCRIQLHCIASQGCLPSGPTTTYGPPICIAMHN
jgi:hypothetical protein